mmetsp:Transcript_12258/g.26166  ORF Transcript_12258/g.26166 Transcript_12258/m.26166 type:complete len:546 (+) Transcript_12258:86-1723(+)
MVVVIGNRAAVIGAAIGPSSKTIILTPTLTSKSSSFANATRMCQLPSMQLSPPGITSLPRRRDVSIQRCLDCHIHNFIPQKSSSKTTHSFFGKSPRRSFRNETNNRCMNFSSSSNNSTNQTNANPHQNQQQIRNLTSEAAQSSHQQESRLNPLIQSLANTLLKPRSIPLIPRWISPQHYSFNLSECFGHSSFILVALSYYSDDFLQLRLMAVLGSTSMLVFTYFHPHGRILWLPLKWNMLFIAINSYRIGKVLLDRWKAEKIDPGLKKFREDHLYVMDEVDFLKLMKIAKEEVFEEGDVVLLQGFANPHIRVVLEGELEVRRDGTLTYILEEGNFISEAGLHAGLMLTGTIESCASIVVGKNYDIDHRKEYRSKVEGKDTIPTKNKVRLLSWDRTELIHLLESDKSLRNSLKAALSWDIVRKLKLQRHMLTQNRVQNPAAWTRKREDQGISRYASILQNMLRHPDEVKNMSEVLTKYRIIHHIEDGDHERALAKCGWTEEEFRKGAKEGSYDEEEYEDITEEEFLNNRWRKVKRFSSKLVRSVTN